MGMILSSIYGKLFGRIPMRILMLGLDDAGKTTILYRFKLGETVTTIPTIGLNVETIDIRNVSLTVWDIHGRDRHRRLWQCFFEDTQGVIFVVDSSDRERIDDARFEIKTMLENEKLEGVTLLVFANKQDLPNAMNVEELTELLQLNSINNHQWHIQPTVAIKGEGLYDGLNWFTDKLMNK